MKTLVIFCVLVSVYTYSEACACVSPHAQVLFCNADFVIRARILGRTITGGSPLQGVYYRVLIRQYYKRGPGRRRRISRIYTASQGALCGVSFQIGREYIIAGFIQNNRWSASLCSWNPPTSSLTQFQRNALRYGYYRNNCACDIFDCTLLDRFDRYPCPVSTRNRCVIRDNSNCFWRNNACINSGRGCRWQSNACRAIPDLAAGNVFAGPPLQ